MENRRIFSVLRIPFFITLVAFSSAGAYLACAGSRNGEFGFPLDDAWIHQVFARNLGTRGEFAFFPGQPSAGSTSPLWAMLLSVGYFLRIDYRVWTMALGIALLAGSAWLATRVAARLENGRWKNDVQPAMLNSQRWTIFLLLTEWHLVWAAVSGMEVLLFVFLELALVIWFFENRNAFVLGIIAGLITLTRPEGVVLGALAVGGLVLQRFVTAEPNPQSFFKRAVDSFSIVAKFAVAFFLLIAPYLAFNLATSGTLLPNTFYAKSEEYLALTNDALDARWFALWLQPLIGAQILLVPGLIYFVWRALTQNGDSSNRRYDILIPLVWMVALITLYAIRLPVSYQHGRYEMPVIPFLIIYGIVGTRALMERITKVTPSGVKRSRRVTTALMLTLALLALAFWFSGESAYATDTAVINCEMVATAKWSARNIPPGELIAAHDIGAQGYFDSHPLLDLAGLVTPDVIPFIRDEARLRSFIRARGARYAIFFPDWYPRLATDASLTRVFSTNCAVTREQGGDNLGVWEVEK